MSRIFYPDGRVWEFHRKGLIIWLADRAPPFAWRATFALSCRGNTTRERPVDRTHAQH